MTQQNFLSNESGAVTVDWVVLTAALVGLGLAVMGVMSSGLQNQSTQVATQLSDGSIIRTSFTGGSQAALSSACSTGADCSAFVSGDALTALTTDELNTEITNADSLLGVADFDPTNYGPGLEQSGATGEWGTYGTPGDESTFTSDAGANAEYTQLGANDAYQASLADEANARAN